MSDLTRMVAGLRADTAQLTWPDAAEVRTRADRRTTRRWIAAAAAVGVAVAVTGGVFLTGGRRSPAPAGPGVTTRLPLDAIAAAPSRTIFAITHTCGPGDCSESTPQRHYALLRSTDLGRNWTTVAPLDGVAGGADVGLGLVAADDGVLWIADGTRFMGSADGGRHWSGWELGADPTRSKGGGLAGTTLWLAYHGKVLRGSAAAGPYRPPANRPAGDRSPVSPRSRPTARSRCAPRGAARGGTAPPTVARTGAPPPTPVPACHIPT